MAFAAAPGFADLPDLPAKTRNFERDKPEQRALRRLLSDLVGSHIEAFDEEPLPVAVADRAYRLLDLLASLDFRASAATTSPTSIVLHRATSGIDRVKHSTGGTPRAMRHAPSYRSEPPFGCPAITYVQLSH